MRKRVLYTEITHLPHGISLSLSKAANAHVYCGYEEGYLHETHIVVVDRLYVVYCS